MTCHGQNPIQCQGQYKRNDMSRSKSNTMLRSVSREMSLCSEVSRTEFSSMSVYKLKMQYSVKINIQYNARSKENTRSNVSIKKHVKNNIWKLKMFAMCQGHINVKVSTSKLYFVRKICFRRLFISMILDVVYLFELEIKIKKKEFTSITMFCRW